MSEFKPLRYFDGYLPLEGFGLVGDGSTAGLIGRDGSLAWLCLPRFDSPPVFAAILDTGRGGTFKVAPDDILESRQYYEPGTAVLVTEMRTPSGLLKLTDAMTLHNGADLTENAAAGRSELVRLLEAVDGDVDVRIDIQPKGGARTERISSGWSVSCIEHRDVTLHLSSSESLAGIPAVHHLRAGERLELALCWGRSLSRSQPLDVEGMLESTRSIWRRWLSRLMYDGPRLELVRRSAITLKLLDYFENGAIVAAPTSSLPEAIGGPRNWDYRYAWVRDASYSVYALRRLGLLREGDSFLRWVLGAARAAGTPKILYDIDGGQPPTEREATDLEGYRRSHPVRWGNAAANQVQNDVYGEILDCAHQWASWGGQVDSSLWGKLRSLVESARMNWRRPDHGIWEVRTVGRPFTYSAALCQVALDRGARIAARFGLPGDIDAWRAEADLIRQTILTESWDASMNALTEHLGGGGLDASLLSLPLRRVIPADDPRMVATTAAIRQRLGAGNGLLYRYLPDESPDGLRGHEGAFLLCSFWLVDNLAYQDRLDEAMELYDSLCDRAGVLGLLPEQIDPDTGAFLGNYPQAFSHIGVISSGINLAQRLKDSRD